MSGKKDTIKKESNGESERANGRFHNQVTRDPLQSRYVQKIKGSCIKLGL